nr:TRAP transporter small permease [Pseudovibrio flavus]
MVTYEVIMRYVFTMPTIWVDEVSRVAQIWAAYLAGAFALKHREMIVIDVAFRNPESVARKVVETFALLVILVFCSVVIFYGYELWLKSTLRGHTTDTQLGLPKAFTQASIWVGFGLLALQSLAELGKIWTQGVPADAHSELA